MQPNYVQRIRLTFSKIGSTRFISHLDLARALERALNRAHIPVAYTQGFNRRPRMQFASALPLGFTSEGELADIWLGEEMEPAQVQKQLMAKMAPGIVIHDVQTVSLDAPALQTVTFSAAYVATIAEPIEQAALQARIDAFMAAREVMRERRGKAYNLRNLVEELSLEMTNDGSLCLQMLLALRPGETGRPDELLAALELEPLDTRVQRTAINLIDEA